MALVPTSDQHEVQIFAGTLGRRTGHKFEQVLTAELNKLDLTTIDWESNWPGHLVTGQPAAEILKFIARKLGLTAVTAVRAWWVGALATSGEGDQLLDASGSAIKRCKSDILLELTHTGGLVRTGVSVKTCSKPTPTNDQLFFTTASAFCKLLRENGIAVSQEAETALRMFCGDKGYTPIDAGVDLTQRQSDPERWFWEELPAIGKAELEHILGAHQAHVSLLLLQKAYADDPYPPEFLLHQTVAYQEPHQCPMALFQMVDLVELSRKYNGFHTNPYRVHKGRFKGDPAVHEAPRFGFIQFQRGGQKQHPTQLQFNLQAGYFNKLPE